MVRAHLLVTGMSLSEGYSLFVAEALSHTRHREHIPSRICLLFSFFSLVWSRVVLERAEWARRSGKREP